MGEAGVTVSAEKEGVNDFDQRIKPPESQLYFLLYCLFFLVLTLMRYRYVI